MPVGTRYDEPTASDGYGGPHPLAGIPQEVLDAARRVLNEAKELGDLDEGRQDTDPIADSVVMALLPWLRP